MLTAELIDKAINAAHVAGLKIEERRFKVPAFTLRYDLRGKMAGLACYNYRTEEAYIRLNPWQLENNTEDMLAQTIPHEVAHLAACRTFGRLGSGHSRFWAMIMRSIGLEPTRCHNYARDPKAKHTKRFRFTCAHGKCDVGVRVYTKVKAGCIYWRKGCKCRLQVENISQISREEV